MFAGDQAALLRIRLTRPLRSPDADRGRNGVALCLTPSVSPGSRCLDPISSAGAQRAVDAPAAFDDQTIR
jgi:hypothetical protein